MAWLWCRPTVAAPIQPQAGELPYAAGGAIKKKKKKKKVSCIRQPLGLCAPPLTPPSTPAQIPGCPSFAPTPRTALVQRGH